MLGAIGTHPFAKSVELRPVPLRSAARAPLRAVSVLLTVRLNSPQPHVAPGHGASKPGLGARFGFAARAGAASTSAASRRPASAGSTRRSRRARRGQSLGAWRQYHEV